VVLEGEREHPLRPGCAVYVPRDEVQPVLEARLARDAEELAETMRGLAGRYRMNRTAVAWAPSRSGFAGRAAI